MKLLVLALGGLGAALGYAAWSKNEKKKAGEVKPAPRLRPCMYSSLALQAWGNANPTLRFFVAQNVDTPPTWSKMVDAGWTEDLVSQVLSGYKVVLVTVPKDGLNPHFWIPALPIGPNGTTWTERADYQASYCKSLNDQA